MRVAVIGSNGFIGRHLVARLQSEAGLDMRLFGRSSASAGPAQIPYAVIQFHNYELLKNQIQGTELIYYLASETIPASSWENPKIELEKNLLPFLNLLDVAAHCGVKKLAFISSAGTIYGPANGHLHEDSNKQPFSPYGIVKLTMENFLSYYRQRFGLHSDVFRVSNVYGEGQDTSKGLGLINTFLEKIVRGEQVKVYGDGNNIRNYIYVKDVADILCLSLNALNQSQVYNVSSDATLTINQVIDQIKKQVSETFGVIYEPVRGSDNPHILLDNARLLKRMGTYRFTPVEQGILQTYQFIKSAKGIQ